MLLSDYVKIPGASVTKLADLSGVSRQYLYEVMSGRSAPSVTVAKKISDATGGIVSLDDIAAGVSA